MRGNLIRWGVFQIPDLAFNVECRIQKFLLVVAEPVEMRKVGPVQANPILPDPNFRPRPQLLAEGLDDGISHRQTSRITSLASGGGTAFPSIFMASDLLSGRT